MAGEATAVADVALGRVAEAGKFLTFALADEVYGLEILKVQEIIGLMPITRIPRVPANVRGVINLRGKVIPVVDLRLKFGLERVEDTERTCIIVVEVAESDRALTIGVLVDEVSEVVDIQQAEIEETPSFGASVDTDFLLGVGKGDQRVVLLLDIDKVLTGEELTVAADAAGELEPEAD